MTVKVSQGNVTIEVADHLKPSPEAGTLNLEQILRLTKARTGVGLAADACAAAMETLGPKFMPPPGVTAEILRAAAARAEDVDQVITNIELLLNTFKQANLMWDAECAQLLAKVNDQVKAQGKHDESILVAFRAVIEYFASKKPEMKKTA